MPGLFDGCALSCGVRVIGPDEVQTRGESAGGVFCVVNGFELLLI